MHVPKLLLYCMKDASFFFLLLILFLSKLGTAGEKIQTCFANDKSKAPLALKTAFSLASKPYHYQVLARFPHRTSAFTEGLVFYKNNLYESTGLLGESRVVKLNLNTGKALVKSNITEIYFGEGLTVFKQQLVQISLKKGKVLFFRPDNLQLIKEMKFEHEAWGSTTIENRLVISDGSSNLLFINPEDFKINKILKVTLQDKKISGLNELEFAEGNIYANVWPSNCIVEINPSNGEITGWLDLSKLLPEEDLLPESAVLNGIAYHKQKHSFFITGKLWPFIYQIKLQANDN